MGVKAKVKKFAFGKFAKSLKSKVKGEVVAKEVKVKGKEPAKAVEEVGKEPSEFVGFPARVVHEEYVQIFGETGEVTKELGDHVLFKVKGDFKTHKVRKEDVEVLSFLVPPQAPRALNLNQGDKAVLFAQFPDICKHAKEGLGPDQMVSGDHIKLGWWVIQRDLIEVGGACLVDLIVAYRSRTASSKSHLKL